VLWIVPFSWPVVCPVHWYHLTENIKVVFEPQRKLTTKTADDGGVCVLGRMLSSLISVDEKDLNQSCRLLKI